MNKKVYMFFVLVLFVISGCASSKTAKSGVAPDVDVYTAETGQQNMQEEEQEEAEPVLSEPEKVKEEPPPPQMQIPDETLYETEEAVKEEEPQKAERPVDSGKISLNFDDADIYEVINALSDIMGINYIIDPAVKGKVNINTSGEIDKSQLLPILETIFEINNIAMVPYGDLYKIVPVKEAYTQMMDFSIGTDPPDFDSYDQVLIQIVPLQHVAAAEVANLLKRFLRRGGDIINYDRGNFVIIIDAAANVRKLLGLIRIIDTDVFQNTDIRFLKISFADVNDIAKELDDIFSSLGIQKTTEKGIGLKFIPIERVGCVLAISSIPGIFERVEHWVQVLDRVDVEASEQIFIYFVENGKASELADVLQKIYGEGVKEGETTRTRKPAEGKEQAASPAVLLEGKLKIVTDSSTNSIIVRSTPHDYSIIKDTIQRLDIMPRQVLIEVFIAEVTLSGDTQFGVEWALRGDSARIGGYKGMEKTEASYGLGGLGAELAENLGKGLTYRFDSRQLQAFLMAQASQNKLNILSSPHILAAENKEARIEVGKEVPIVTSDYSPLDRQDTTSTSRSIEYRSTGVILRVTPRISDKGLVAMDIMQEVSEAQEVQKDGIQSPVISQRRAETSLVVSDGQTIVIGGLIKNQSSQSRTGVPFVSKIPVFGYLFGSTRDTQEKTELLISITPHVVNTVDAVEAVSVDFQEKLEAIKKLLNRQ